MAEEVAITPGRLHSASQLCRLAVTFLKWRLNYGDGEKEILMVGSLLVAYAGDAAALPLFERLYKPGDFEQRRPKFY